MKYVLLFCGTPEDQAAFDALSREDLAEQYARVGRWFEEHGSVITGSNYLQPRSLRFRDRDANSGFASLVPLAPAFMVSFQPRVSFTRMQKGNPHETDCCDHSARKARSCSGRSQ